MGKEETMNQKMETEYCGAFQGTGANGYPLHARDKNTHLAGMSFRITKTAEIT